MHPGRSQAGVSRKLGSADVIDVLADRFIARGTPGFISSDNKPDNEPEFVALAVKGWATGVGAKTAYIEPGSPWENGYVESFNGKLRDELLNMEVQHAPRPQDPDRAMAGALQHRATTLLLGIPAARAGGHHAEQADAAWSSRINRITAAVSYNAALTSYPDHSVEAGHKIAPVS